MLLDHCEKSQPRWDYHSTTKMKKWKSFPGRDSNNLACLAHKSLNRWAAKGLAERNSVTEAQGADRRSRQQTDKVQSRTGSRMLEKTEACAESLSSLRAPAVSRGTHQSAALPISDSEPDDAVNEARNKYSTSAPLVFSACACSATE